jgi:hypothetical protein
MPKVLAYIVAGLIIVYAFVAGMKGDFPDSKVYYEAAHGHYLMTATQKPEGTFLVGWIYPDNTRFIWYWMRLFSWRVDSIIWFIIQSISLLYLTHRLTKELGKYAWVILASLWWPIGWFLSGSNISITLLACVLNPWLAAVACVVKPYLIVFFLLHLWVESRAIVGHQAV